MKVWIRFSGSMWVAQDDLFDDEKPLSKMTDDEIIKRFESDLMANVDDLEVVRDD